MVQATRGHQDFRSLFGKTPGLVCRPEKHDGRSGILQEACFKKCPLEQMGSKMQRHPYGIVDPFLQVDVADAILDEFFHIAEQLKIRAFLVFGLCLGFVRDGGYIEGDNDLDVGVVCNEDEKERLVNLLKENSFSQGRSFRHNNIHFYKNKILVDIHFKESRGYYSNFGNVQYKGKEYPVPHPVEGFLTACYANWQIKENKATRYYG